MSFNAGALTKTWLPTNGGSWATGTNWSGGVAPVAGDDVIINSNQSSNITAIPGIILNSLTITGNCLLAAASSGNEIIITSNFFVAAGVTCTMGISGGRLVFTLNGIGTIAGNLAFDAGSTVRNFTVNGTLIVLPTGRVYDPVISAGSAFILGANATLKVGNTGGISNVQTTNTTVAINFGGSYTYPTTANYEYIGTVAQVTGVGLPATVKSLTINNSAGVTLTSAVAVTTNLALTNTAVLNLGTFTTSTAATMSFNGAAQVAGTWGYTGSGATNINTTYFGNNTGRVTVAGATLPSCSINLTSAANTDNQAYCANSPIVNITYATVAATGATVTGLPTGVTSAWASNVLTISGTPTVTGFYTYTITLSGGGCINTKIGTLSANVNMKYTSPNTFAPSTLITPLNPTFSIPVSVSGYTISPALTATGLSFNTSNGQIYGTTTSGSVAGATYTVTATLTCGGSLTFGVVIAVGNYRYAVASGNWNATSTWSTASGGTAGASVPTAGDNVYIGEGSVARTVTIPTTITAACNTLNIGLGDFAGVLSFTDATNTMTVSGNVNMNVPNTGVTSAINLGAGTLTVNGDMFLAKDPYNNQANGNTLVNQVNISTGTLTINGDLYFNAFNAAQSRITFSGAGTLNLKGNFNIPNLLGTLTPSTGTVNFNGTSVAQLIPIGVSAITYNNLTINNTHANGATLGAAITATNVTGNISVGNINSGSLLNTSTYNVTRPNSSQITVAAGSTLNAGTSVIAFGTTGTITINGTLKTANTLGFSGTASTAISSTNTPTITIGSASTIEYNAAGTQATTARTDYANITLTGGSKTIPTGTTTLSKNLLINTGATYNGTTNNPVLNIGGNFTNSGTFNSGTGIVSFTNGQSAANNATGVSTFTNLTINNTNGLVINNDETVTGTLTFTSGVITTGANRLIMGSAGSAGTVSRTAGHVNGNVRRYIPNSAAPIVGFDIGDATNYTPVSLTFFGTVSGSGYFDASTTVAAPPVASGLSQTKYVNRKWTLTNTSVAGFTSYSPTFTFVAGDKIGTPNYAAFTVRKSAASVWSTTTNGNLALLSTQCAGILNSFSGDFAIGEDACQGITLWLGSTSTDWHTASNWCSGAVPTSTDNVEILSGAVYQPTIGATAVCNNIIIDAGATLTITGSNSLTVSGNWTKNGSFTANTSTVNFNGSAAQTINGASTFSTLKINNAAGVTLAAAATVTNLTIGDGAANSVFNDGGFQITGTGTLTLTSGTFKVGAGASATSYPSFTTCLLYTSPSPRD